jgi:pyruvate, water dikinase
MDRIFTATTGWDALDVVMGGIQPGDNIVWGVDQIREYRKLVLPYEAAAREAGRRRIYFRFAPHEPLLGPENGVEVHQVDPFKSFEGFVRSVHIVIEDCGPGAVYIFDSLSHLGDAWHSDQAVGNFFVLTCPRLRDLQTVTYFAIERERHSIHAIGPIRRTTQFYLDVFTLDGKFYIRPVKVQYRSISAMDTVHVEEGDKLVPVSESATLAQILSRTRWPRLWRNRRLGYWARLFSQVERVVEEKAAGGCPEGLEEEMLRQVRSAFRVRRSGIANLVEEWLTIEDFDAIRQRLIGIGSIGGKALGMLVARAILRQAPDLAGRLEVHDSFFVGAEVFVTFLAHNGVWWIREQQKTPYGFLQDLGEGRDRILSGQFPSDILIQFEGMLDYFGEKPCIVRSSSILEDARGNAFSGKYESIFLSNRGSREERLAALLDAIREVYASVLDQEALLYRKSRNLLDSEERMALLIMRVSGAQRGRWFFPQAAGVGLSYNPFRWHPEIDPEAGVARLVFGLGTRAVDRSDDDYTRLVSLSAPLRRPESSLDEQLDHSQRRMDVIDLKGSGLVSLPVEKLAPECRDFPVELFIDKSPEGMPWVTFDGLLQKTAIVDDLKRMLAILAKAYGQPVDIEFALNFLPDGSYRIHLLQCRTFQIQKAAARRGVDPARLPGQRVLEAQGAVIGLGREVPLDDILYVPTEAYAALSDAERHRVAKLIEVLVQKHDPARSLILIGPGRWGTSSPSLGIPVRAGRIARASAVCEIVAMHSGLIPDVSLGTHFFNDLVEHDLLYLACFPGKPGNAIDEQWLLEQASHTASSTTKFKAQHSVVRWITPGEGALVLHADPWYQSAAIRFNEPAS